MELALHKLAGYDPIKFEAATDEYLASIGAAKPDQVSQQRLEENQDGEKN